MDVLKLQGEVARAVAEEIRIPEYSGGACPIGVGGHNQSGGTSRICSAATTCGNSTTRAPCAPSITSIGRREIAPAYAAAYAGLSYAWWVRGTFGSLSLKEVESPTRLAAQRALALDDRLAEAHVALGRIKDSYDWDWRGAEVDYRRAFDIDPNDLDAHYFYAMLLMRLGRFSESLTHIQRAAELDPLSATIQAGFGRILYRARRFDEAISPLDRAIMLEPRGALGYYRLGDVYNQMGRHAKALAAYEKASALQGRAAVDGADVARVYARMGKHNEARKLLDTLRSRLPHAPDMKLAQAYAALGDKDEAFRLLFRYVEERYALGNIQDPPFDSLHSDPRWRVLLRRMNFPADANSGTCAHFTLGIVRSWLRSSTVPHAERLGEALLTGSRASARSVPELGRAFTRPVHSG